MIIGLDYLPQIRGGDDSGQVVGGATDEAAKASDVPQALGGWIALQLNKLVATISAGYHTEHNSDDTHRDIHANSISERGRLTANGVWSSVPFNPANFVGSGAMTVSVGSQVVFAYTLYGKTMLITFVLNSVTIGGTPDTYIKIRIPGGYTSGRTAVSSIIAFNNSATVGSLAYALMQAPSATTEPYVFCALAVSGSWAASAAFTSLYGQICFEIA